MGFCPYGCMKWLGYNPGIDTWEWYIQVREESIPLMGINYITLLRCNPTNRTWDHSIWVRYPTIQGRIPLFYSYNVILLLLFLSSPVEFHSVPRFLQQHPAQGFGSLKRRWQASCQLLSGPLSRARSRTIWGFSTTIVCTLHTEPQLMTIFFFFLQAKLVLPLSAWI